MSESVLTYMKIIFLFGFTLHNIEEAIWLPEWSKFAKKFHEPVESSQFIFAVIIVTIAGYILTALDILFGFPGNFFNYLYLGFIGMMCINTIFPHLLSTIVLKKYTPGLITALALNLPFSLILIFGYIEKGINIYYLLVSIIIVSGVVLISLKYLFKLGKILLNFSNQSPAI